MNVIVIDDLINIVEDIVAGINWKRLKIDKVFKACSSNEAKKIIQSNHVDIMICDIEMPLENGLKLFEWVSQKHLGIECIFLTSFSEFNYAKEAIRLGSFDYLLKPIRYDELEAVIEKALIKIHIDRQVGSNSEYWKENIAKIQEKFWYDLLKGIYMTDTKKIVSVAETCNILNIDEKEYQLILIRIMEREMIFSDLDDDLIKHKITNIFEELLGGVVKDQQIVQIDSGMFVLVRNSSSKETEYHLKSVLELFIQVCYMDLKCSMDIYVSGYSGISELPKITKELTKKVDENVADYKKVFFLRSDENTEKSQLKIDDIVKWETLLIQGYNSEVEENIVKYIQSLVKQGQLNREMFAQLHSQLFRMLDKVFAEKHFDAYSLFRREDVALLYVKSLDSVDKLQELIKTLLCNEFFDDERGHGIEMSVYSIDSVKDYICNNLEKALSRQELANRIFLNPEYLSRLFKKTTGISLTEFIKNERMNMAKHLLRQTDMPVSIIASKVGYSNFSHFSHIFKQHTNLSPVAYRQRGL